MTEWRKRHLMSFEQARELVEEIAAKYDGSFADIAPHDEEMIRDLVLEHGGPVASFALVNMPKGPSRKSPPANASKRDHDAWLDSTMLPFKKWTKDQWAKAIKQGVWWVNSERKARELYDAHRAGEGASWGPDESEAFLFETRVRDALLRAADELGDDEALSKLESDPLTVRSAYSPPDADYLKRTPRVVYIFNDGRTSLDPTSDEGEKLYALARDHLDWEGGNWQFESYNGAVHYFMVQHPNAMHPVKNPGRARKNPARDGVETYKAFIDILRNPNITADDLEVAQDLLVENSMTLRMVSGTMATKALHVAGRFHVYYLTEGNVPFVEVREESRDARRMVENTWVMVGPAQPTPIAAIVASTRMAWNLVKEIVRRNTERADVGPTMSQWAAHPFDLLGNGFKPYTQAEIYKPEAHLVAKQNPPGDKFDDFRKTLRGMGGLVNGKIDLRDSHEHELELFVMNEYELYQAVKEQSTSQVKSVVDQFFLYTPTQFEQLMSAVDGTTEDAGSFRDNPRMDDDLDDVIDSANATNADFRRQLADARAKVAELRARTSHAPSHSPAGRKLTAAVALVRSLEAKIEQHSNLTAELGRPRRNPAGAQNPQREAAIGKYKEFWRQEPTKVGEFSATFKIPRKVHKLGRAIHVLYESLKTDPETLKKPRKPLAYIHEHDNPDAYLYDLQGAADTDVPSFIADAKALVCLGQCLGFKWRDEDGDEHEAEATDPLPDLWCTVDGHALIVIQSKRKVLALTWGDGLKVESRGIVG